MSRDDTIQQAALVDLLAVWTVAERELQLAAKLHREAQERRDQAYNRLRNAALEER